MWADLLEDAAPITCENFWEDIATERRDVTHHGVETGPEHADLESTITAGSDPRGKAV